MEEKKQKKPLNKYARFSGIAFQMIAIIAIGTYIGIRIDEKYPNDNDIYTLLFSLGSVIISILYVIRQIISASKDK